MNTIQKNVEDLALGDLIDLESCPYLKGHSSAPFEFAQVAHVERETQDCVVIGYEGIDHIGYPVGTVLQVRQQHGVPDPAVKVQPVGQLGEWVDWNITLNLTDRWGDINDFDASNKPLESLQSTPGLLECLREQMWDEITFIVRKDGQFGILFEVEYSSIESDGKENPQEADKPFLARLKPQSEVIAAIKRGMLPLTHKYPGVLFAVPDEDKIYNNRPAAWAFVADCLLSDDQRTELGRALLVL